MDKTEYLSVKGLISVFKTEWFSIEGQQLRLVDMQVDPFTGQSEVVGNLEDSQHLFELPPHMMMILGEALQEAAHKEFERLENNFKKSAEKLTAKKSKKNTLNNVAEFKKRKA